MFICNKSLKLWGFISITAAITVPALADDSSNHLRHLKGGEKAGKNPFLNSKNSKEKKKEKKAKDPASKGKNVLPKDKLSKKEVASVDRTKAALEDIESEAKGNPPRFAITNEVSIDPHNGDGTWEVLDDGTQIWRYRMKTRGCNSLNFEFCQYHMPKGGQLFIYDTNDRTSISRPFTEEDNAGGVLWTPVIESCDVIIEVDLHAKVVPEDMKLHLCSANVGYRAFDTRPEEQHGTPRDSGRKGKGRQLSESCNVDVVCDGSDGSDYAGIDGWRNEIPSVAGIATGGSVFCTGAMINNLRNDKTPYFLTAHHCDINVNNAASLVAYWNFETSICGGTPDGELNQFTIGGATHLSDNPDSDMTLVRLNQSPDNWFEVAYAGWDSRPDSSIASQAVCIHHPSGDEKRISFEYDQTALAGWGGGSTTDHIRVADWDLGTTEPGSSGSPLFDQDHRIIGQLHGGTAACGNDSYDIYGRFSTSWVDGGLAQWLDPDNTGIGFVDTFGGTGGPPPTGTSSPTNSPTPCCVGESQEMASVEVVFKTDNYKEESSWTLTNRCTGEQVASKAPDAYARDLTTYTDTYTVAAGKYEFTINDVYGDGICCGYGQGFYRVKYNGVEEAYGDVFDSSETTVIGECSVGGTLSPTSSPTSAPSESPSGTPTRNPTTTPTSFPSNAPSTSAPSESPSGTPTRNPTTTPTSFPSNDPSVSPTGNPTENPTSTPSQSPSASPTFNPTQNPTPSGAPTTSPSKSPSSSPTTSPTKSPTPAVSDVTAIFDTELGVPRCYGVGSSCTSGGDLLKGKQSPNFATKEMNESHNTIKSTVCTDGRNGSYHVDESIDEITVAAVGGGSLKEGGVARISATVWAWSGYNADTADFYYTADVSNPIWTHIGSERPTGSGKQTITAEYNIPSGGLQAVRVNFRYGGSEDECTGGRWDDVDDLVFEVGAAEKADSGLKAAHLDPVQPLTKGDCLNIDTKDRCKALDICKWKRKMCGEKK